MGLIQEIMEDSGFGITYTPDPVFPGDWFCDIRWTNGNLAQTGGGATQEAALRVACIRLSHEPLNLPEAGQIAWKAIHDAGSARGAATTMHLVPPASGD